MAKPEKKAVTPETVRQIADIAGLDMSDERVAQLTPQIQSVRESINAMDDVDLTDIEPSIVFVPETE
jgi:Asp-tRNA(Asn)/Glu-tRNA(Gln) amidotransferase C subunit